MHHPPLDGIARGWVAAGLLLAGCAGPLSSGRIEEAARLAREGTGHEPEWLTAWDQDGGDWPAGQALSLDRALVMALRNNRELRADLELIGQADADLVQAGLMQNPVINFMIMFPEGGGRSMLRGSGLPMQPLQDLWLIPARQEVARAELQQAILRVADRAVATAAEVKATYARLQYAQEAIALIRENMALVGQSTDIIQVRQAAGQATQVEVTLSAIRSLRLRSDLIAMEAEYRGLQRELLLLIGHPSATDDWRVELIAQTTAPPAAPPDEETLLSQAQAQRLDLKAAEWMVTAAHRRVALRKREGLPDLALGLSFERMAAPRSNNPSLAGRAGNAVVEGVNNGLTGQMGGGGMPGPFAPKMREVDFTVGPMVELEVPIFDWGQAQTARAVHEYNEQQARYEALAQGIIRAVRQARVSSQAAWEQVAFYRQSLIPEVERNLELARQSFVAGRESITVYFGVQEDLISLRLKLLEFIRDDLVARAELEREVGGQLPPPDPGPSPASAPAA